MKQGKRSLGLLVGVGLALFLAGCTRMDGGGGWAARDAITIGVIAPDSAEAASAYKPFAGLLGARIDKQVVVRACPSADALGQACGQGTIDFLILSPTDYLTLHDSARVEAIASMKNKGGTPYCQGTLVTAKGKGIESVSDIKGKKFRFGPEGSFNKFYAALHVLEANGIDFSKDLAGVSYGSGCGGIAQYILSGEADAGVVCDYSWDGWVSKKSKDPNVDDLLIIGKAPKLRETAIAAAPDVDARTRAKVLEGLVSLREEPQLLEPPLKARGFAASTDKDYDALRRILKGLEK